MTTLVEAGEAPGLILFDCDGTLVDSHGHIVAVMRRAFVETGLNVPAEADVRAIIGLSLDHAVRALLPDADEKMRITVAEAYRRLYRGTPVDHGLHAGVRETLVELARRGWWMGVVTGKSTPGLMRVFDAFELADFFPVWRTADQCPSKPHPAMALECMEEMGGAPDRTIVVGDAVMDMQMAKAAGMRGIGVSFGAADAAALMQAGAADVVHRFTDLLAHFPPLRAGAASCTIGA